MNASTKCYTYIYTISILNGILLTYELKAFFLNIALCHNLNFECNFLVGCQCFLFLFFFLKMKARTYASLQLHWMLSIPVANHQHHHPLAQFLVSKSKLCIKQYIVQLLLNIILVYNIYITYCILITDRHILQNASLNFIIFKHFII